MAKNSKGGNKSAKKKKAGVSSDAEKVATREDAREQAQAATEAAQEGDTTGGDAGADEAVAEARAEIEAENSPADYVAPLTPNDQLAVDDLDDDSDDEDAETDFPVQPDHVARNTIELASMLPRDEDATERMKLSEAAKKVGIKDKRSVTGFAVRGDDIHGRYVVVTTHDGQKLSAAM